MPGRIFLIQTTVPSSFAGPLRCPFGYITVRRPVLGKARAPFFQLNAFLFCFLALHTDNPGRPRCFKTTGHRRDAGGRHAPMQGLLGVQRRFFLSGGDMQAALRFPGSPLLVSRSPFLNVRLLRRLGRGMEADWVSKTDIEKRTPDNESRTSRDGLVLVRDGLLVGIPKHGVSWKGDYIDEGLFAGPRRVGGKVRMQKQNFWVMVSFLQCRN